METAVRRTFQAAGLLTHRMFAELPSRLDSECREIYLEELARRAGSAAVFTNTHPARLHDAARVAAAIPNVRFILIKRNLEDNILRIYMQKYTVGHADSYDLKAIREGLAWYHEMIDLLAAKLPDIARVITYEDMVADPPAAISRCRIVPLADGPWSNSVHRRRPRLRRAVSRIPEGGAGCAAPGYVDGPTRGLNVCVATGPEALPGDQARATSSILAACFQQLGSSVKSPGRIRGEGQMNKGWQAAFAAGLSLGAICAAATLVGAQTATKGKVPAPAQAGKSMSVEEARRIAAQTQTYVRPPRTIDDIAKILDQHKPNPVKIKQLQETADKKTPPNLAGIALADFLYERANAARELGRTQQRLADLREAYKLAKALVMQRSPIWIADFPTREQSKRLRRLSSVHQRKKGGEGTCPGCRRPGGRRDGPGVPVASGASGGGGKTNYDFMPKTAEEGSARFNERIPKEQQRAYYIVSARISRPNRMRGITVRLPQCGTRSALAPSPI